MLRYIFLKGPHADDNQSGPLKAAAAAAMTVQAILSAENIAAGKPTDQSGGLQRTNVHDAGLDGKIIIAGPDFGHCNKTYCSVHLSLPDIRRLAVCMMTSWY